MRPVFLLAAIALCLFSCKKSDAVMPGLFGKWELRETSGGYPGHDSLYKAGNGNTYQFKSDSSFSHFTNGKADAQGNYHVRKISNSPDDSSDEIFFNNDVNGEPVIINGTQMTLGTSAADGLTFFYQKIGN